jgi:pseudaminic acid synthase
MQTLKSLLRPLYQGGRADGPFVIAEMSGNHKSSLDHALALVDAAAEAGADAIKLQTYTADTMTLPVREREFVIEDPKSLWAGRALHDLYQEAATPWEWHEPIMRRARERGILCFSSAFDRTAVDLLESLEAPCYKIASFECVDTPLIRAVAATGKPVIISTGMATIVEIAEAVDAARDAGCRHLVLLQCTSNYPAPPEHSNLRVIPHMRELFGCEVGLSDHTIGIGVPVAAIALGATVIEKHITMSRDDGAVDSAFSAEPAEMASLVEQGRRAWQALGEIRYGPTEVERNARRRRRSLYVSKDVAAGETFSEANLRSIRPGHGLEPKYYDMLLGRRAARDVKMGTPMSWDLIG